MTRPGRTHLLAMTGAYAAALVAIGIWLMAAPCHSPMLRLTGVHDTAMGLYLATLAAEGRRRPLTLVLRARVLLVICLGSALTLPGAAQVGQATRATAFVALALEGAWLLATLWVARLATCPVKPFTDRPMPSRLHNVVLGALPLGEALGVCLLGTRYGPMLLGLHDSDASAVDAWWFGLCSLNLAVFWWIIVRTRARRTLAATLWGRVGVALAFVAFDAAGVGGDSSRLLWLSPMLLASAVWTGLELWTRLLPWQKAGDRV